MLDTILAGENASWLVVLGGAVLFLLGGGGGMLFVQQARKNQLKELEAEAEDRALKRLEENERSQRLKLLEEKEEWYKEKNTQEQEVETKVLEQNRRNKSLVAKQREVDNHREDLRKELKQYQSEEKRLESRVQAVREAEDRVEKTGESYREKLEVVANLTADEAKEQLLENLAADIRARSAAMIRAERAKAKEESEREAKKIIAQAIQRCAVDEAVQVSTSSVHLPNENLKSRIIGKEGRNVRTFEAATGVKVVVDDTPDTVLLSSFDPAKREVAMRSMQRLISDGGFTPARIEEVVGACKKDLDEDMVRAGRKALKEIDNTDGHPDLPRYVGMLKYRTSFGQNLLQHCLEVAHLSGLMAAELGADVRLAKRAGLLHDIGKTVNREMEGSHVEVGIELGEKFGEHPIVKEVIAEHHEDSERQSAICFLVKAADTISSIRPGGRREDSEGYARRIMRLVEIANSFEGVKDVFAINAGREIRVMVRGERIGDDDAEILAFDIAERVKSEMTFAGQVKVVVVRETRAVRYSGKGNRNRNKPTNPNGPNSPNGRNSRNGRYRGRRVPSEAASAA
jgi:ribonucrease Y